MIGLIAALPARIAPRLRVANRVDKSRSMESRSRLSFLTQPVGWMFLAIVVGIIVGLFVSEKAWYIVGGLLATCVLGMAYPYLLMKFCRVTVEWSNDRLSEDETLGIMVTVHNPLPIPAWGLVVEACRRPDWPATDKSVVEERRRDQFNAMLACVPAMRTTQFCVHIDPKLRGEFPYHVMTMATSFPFGLWTARKHIETASKVCVWPRVYALQLDHEKLGCVTTGASVGHGKGLLGEIQGVRPYQRGDKLSAMHWSQTAKQSQLMVCERTDERTKFVAIFLDVSSRSVDCEVSRENLAWRIRVAASIARQLHSAGVICRVATNHYLNAPTTVHTTPWSLAKLLDEFAMIPTDGYAADEIDAFSTDRLGQDRLGSIHITTSDLDGKPFAEDAFAVSYATSVAFPHRGSEVQQVFRLAEDIPSQLEEFLGAVPCPA